jgi:hypothetical protein
VGDLLRSIVQRSPCFHRVLSLVSGIFNLFLLAVLPTRTCTSSLVHPVVLIALSNVRMTDALRRIVCADHLGSASELRGLCPQLSPLPTTSTPSTSFESPSLDNGSPNI